MIKIVNGNILDADEKYIAHQCNLCTTRAAGVAKAIFNKYPHANIYKDRIYGAEIDFSQSGTIVICGNEDERLVVNMKSQVYPGKPKFPDSKKDAIDARLSFFESALNKISEIKDLESIAFPYNIGCGMAGGNWDDYYQLLSEFAHKVDATVTLYNWMN